MVFNINNINAEFQKSSSYLPCKSLDTKDFCDAFTNEEFSLKFHLALD